MSHRPRKGYRYMNFNEIGEFQEVADTVTV
jgi:hypothetical protein